jgi:hypothetical protein
VAGSARAQTHKVAVVSESADSELVASALKAKIGGTLRYQLSESLDLVVTLQCVKVDTKQAVKGIACAATILYFPKSLGGLEIPVTPSVSIGPDANTVAQFVFENFVNETTEPFVPLGVSGSSSPT